MTGAQLRAFRTEEGMTQAELADFVGVEANTIARWERDEAPIPKYVWRICTLRAQLVLAHETARTLAWQKAQQSEALMVRAFHAASGQPVRERPEVPPENEVRLRMRLITEEFFEMLEAVFPQDGFVDKPLFMSRIDYAPLRVDLPELVDAWADLKYVIVGSELTFGVDGAAVFRVVHAANMKKFGPGGGTRADGKIMKPPGWAPPDIAGELERQRQENQ